MNFRAIGLLVILFSQKIPMFSQQNYFSLSVNPGLSIISTSKLHRVVWNYEADFNKVLGKPKLKNILQPTVNCLITWGHVFYKKKGLEVRFETGIAYSYSAYYLKWTGEYSVSGFAPLYPYSMEISKRTHYFTVPMMSSISIKKINISIGTLLKLPLYSSGTLLYIQNNQSIYDYVNLYKGNSGLSAKPFDFRISLYMGIGYSFDISKKLILTPNINANIGIYDNENMTFGKVRNRRLVAINQVCVGVKIDINLKKKL